MRCAKTNQQELNPKPGNHRKPNFGCHKYLAQFKEGDQEAFDKLYTEKISHLFRLVLWKASSNLDEWEAEGVVQQALFLVFQKAATYHGQTDAEAWSWIWAITRNHLVDVIRQKNVIQRKEVDLLDETCESQTIPFTEGTIDQKSWLAKFIPSLSSREKLLLKLLCDDVPQKEIAAKLGVCLPRITQIKQSIRKKAQKFEKLLP